MAKDRKKTLARFRMNANKLRQERKQKLKEFRIKAMRLKNKKKYAKK